MEDLGSEATLDSAKSSTMGSSTSKPAQLSTSSSGTQHPPSATVSPGTNDESDSDVSMPAESDDEDEREHTRDSRTQAMVQLDGSSDSSTQPKTETSKKRKYSTDNGTNGHVGDGAATKDVKRSRQDDGSEKYRNPDGRLRPDRSLLPIEIWRQIFAFSPPRVLGQLMQVNRVFHAYLDPSSSSSFIVSLSQSNGHVLKPEAIWQASRKLFRPSMPPPLVGKSELDMWRLACCASCQFCGRKRQPSHMPQMDQWHPGPGQTGVIPIWSFAIRTCGPCFEQRSSKDTELLLSSTIPTPLIAALPFVFMTNELHVIPATVLQKSAPPDHIQTNKYFFKPQVEGLKQELLDIKDKMGGATAEEWLKGLDKRGKEMRNDAGRWERWEATGGVSKMRRNQPHEALKFNVERLSANSIPNLPPKVVHSSSTLPKMQSTTPFYALPQPVQGPIPINPPLRYDSPSQNGFQYPGRPQPPPRHERTKDEVIELKAARRAEIERRSMLLDPPLTPGVLAHMSSFQAAIQIIQPLNDGAWEVLKPRLVAQREEAEQREKDRLAQTRVAQERFDASRWQSMKTDDSKDGVERDWEDVQAPIRSKIGGYADEIIKDGWNNGGKVTRENCGAFATEVLVYVRKRFYAEVAKDEAAIQAAGQTPTLDPSGDLSTRKLILENMKWVFDTKIKPITEQYRKELFLCNDCEGNFKYYGFEGVIQHFAAKHTSALSQGSVVVHWKSEWPEYPPFKTDPNSANHSYHSTGASAGDPYANSTQPASHYGYGGYHPGSGSAPLQGPIPHAYQGSPAPYYGHSQAGDQYAAHLHGPYAPPSHPYVDPAQGYQDMYYSGPPSNGNVHGYNQGHQEYQPQTFGAAPPYGAPIPTTYESPHPGQSYPLSMPDNIGQPGFNPQVTGYDQPYHQPQPASQNNTHNPVPRHIKPVQTEEYKAQLLEVANTARDIWKTFTGIKEIPGSVKVHTILYHILKKSRANHQDDPPLAMISDGLNNNKDMRQIRNINGLLCRACVLGMAGSSGKEKKHFSLPQLVNHFHSIHEINVIEKGLGHVPDWTRDMVELPGPAKLSAITRLPGLDDKKLRILTEALSGILIKSPPTEHEEVKAQAGPYYGEDNSQPYELAPSLDNHERYYKTAEIQRPMEPVADPYGTSLHDHTFREAPLNQRVPENHMPTYATEQRYVEQPPRAVDHQHYVIREEEPVYERIRYRDPEAMDRSARVSYDPTNPGLESRQHNQRSNAEDLPTIMARIAQEKKHSMSFDAHDYLPGIDHPHRVVNGLITQAGRISRNKQEGIDIGSEDGEVRSEQGPRPVEDAERATERFLNGLAAANSASDSTRVDQPQLRIPNDSRAAVQGGQGVRRSQQYSPDSQFQSREVYSNENIYRPSSVRPLEPIEGQIPSGYVLHDRAHAPRLARGHEYDDRYDMPAPPAIPRERSPELVDRRYKLNNVVYREDRQGSQGTYRTPGRYARYESVRLENDRARSRSPVYVKVGSQPGQYRERSPPQHHIPQEPSYRTRTPQGYPEDIAYERIQRPEYYRVYEDEVRPRQPVSQHAESFEYVRVSDPAGDYMIRRPIRREPEPIYVDRATYEDDYYGRQPMYETRRSAHPAQADPAYYEEYDPRHPEPLPGNVVRQVLYE
ncbi:hypothetical protein PVAG01_07769 [Phlyctema vagabunda]|uniref:DUF7892 domain-containing protein n=1 Tax=Phlyctema vagabunda TaxID=108571 RepID=A0ABR4PDC9_9HELO